MIAHAQTPPFIEWQKALGGGDDDFAYSVDQTNDGGIVAVGITTSNDGDVSGNHGGDDIWAVKLDRLGTLLWQKALGGSGEDLGYSVQQTSDGGYIVAGITESNDGDVSGNHGNKDLWVVKLDSLGTLLWQKAFGGSDADLGYSFLKTNDGGFIVAGNTESNNGDVSGNQGNKDFWVAKLAQMISTGADDLGEISEESGHGLSVFPNPTSEAIEISIEVVV